MIRIIKQYIINAIFISCFIQASDSDPMPYPIDLTVYDGQGSLLLSWTYPDSIKVNETRIFVKEFGSKEFILLSALEPEYLHYLDTDCKPDNRYFYKVEVEDIFSRIHHSDLSTPPFGTCAVINDSLVFNKDINSLQDLILSHIAKKVNKSDPYIDFYPIAELLRDSLGVKHNWIELFPLDELRKIEGVIDKVNEVINHRLLLSEIFAYEQRYRNHLYLDPVAWASKVKVQLNKIRNNWTILYKEYPQALKNYEIIAPIRIVGSQWVDNSLVLKLYVFHPDQVSSDQIYLLSGEEYIDLEEFRVPGSSLMTVPIPEGWKYVDLMMDDIFIQNCPLIDNKSVLYTINGDIIPMEVDSNNFIKMGINSSSVWVNEVNWSPYSKKLDLEIAGKPSVNQEYIIKNNDMYLWEVKPQIGYETQFLDSTLAIQEDFTLPTVISLKISNNGNFSTTEYIILDTIPYAISRNPDGGNWYYSEAYTMGSTNEIIIDNYDNTVLPELFVLYQNYPNPFNGQTRISFDLLEDAVVSLYITDATGRIHDKLVEHEYISSGIYNYTWDGEGRSTGIYFITLQAQIGQNPTVIFSRKMIYLK